MVWKTKLKPLRESNRIGTRIDIAFIENGPVVIESIQFKERKKEKTLIFINTLKIIPLIFTESSNFKPP